MIRSWLGVAGSLCVAVLVVASLVQAQTTTASGAAAPPLVVRGAPDGVVNLVADKSAVLTTDRPYRRISVAQPEVADVNGISPTTILVTAKKAGSTQLIIWDEQDRSQVIDVAITMDVEPIATQLKRVFPKNKIDVLASNGAVVLVGRVPDAQTAEQAAALAAPFAPKVVNLLEVAGGQQVMLQVRFAEVSRQAVNALGVSGNIVAGSGFGGTNVGGLNQSPIIPTDGFVGDTPTPQGIDLMGDSRPVNPNVTLFGGGQIGSVYLEAFVQSLRQNNLLRVLAEPNLITTSGQEASFLAGGEFPIPVTQGGGTGAGGTAITVEFREYGVRLTFTPIVLGNGKIRMKVAPEVSDLDFSTAVRFGGFVVPGLTQRRVQTVVELNEGQTFAIAGLLNNSVAANKDVIPLLGDLPIVGALFRSVRYQRKDTELLVMVTPRLVNAMNPHQVPLLPGEQWHHPSEGDLFWNQDLGSPADERPGAPEASQPTRAANARAYYGEAGFAAPSSTGAANEPVEPATQE